MYGWTHQELSTLDLGDKRLDRRAKRTIMTMSQRPSGSISQTFTTRAESEAVYRLVNSDTADSHTVRDGVRDAVREACLARVRDESLILAVQDTTTLNYNSHPACAGLGPIDAHKSHGLLLHSTLAVSDAGVPLGLIDQVSWVRDADNVGTRHQRRERPIKDKESFRWIESQERIQQAVPPSTRVLTVADREADIFALFALQRPEHADLLIRVNHDRRVQGQDRLLWQTVRAAPIRGEVTIDLSRHPERAPRQATLQVSLCPVTVRRPKNGCNDPDLQPIPLIAILAEETEPPTDATPVCWLLLTTLSVDDFEGALRCLSYYSKRWLIERYHFTLKSGCKIEQSQLRTLEALNCLLALYCIVAWRLLWMTYGARVHPDLSCIVAYTEMEWQTLWRLQKGNQPLPTEPPSLKEAVKWTAALAGYLARKGDGDPGVKRLWRGLTRLQDIIIGIRLATPDYPRCE